MPATFTGWRFWTRAWDVRLELLRHGRRTTRLLLRRLPFKRVLVSSSTILGGTFGVSFSLEGGTCVYRRRSGFLLLYRLLKKGIAVLYTVDFFLYLLGTYSVLLWSQYYVYKHASNDVYLMLYRVYAPQFGPSLPPNFQFTSRHPHFPEVYWLYSWAEVEAIIVCLSVLTFRYRLTLRALASFRDLLQTKRAWIWSTPYYLRFTSMELWGWNSIAQK